MGGLAEVKQERQLSRRPEVVVATPGRFWELASTHAHLSRLETLRHLVIDEADRMLERGHYPELNRLFALLSKAEGREEEEGGVHGRGGGASAGGGGGGRNKAGGGPGGGGGGGGFRPKAFPFDISEGGEWSVPGDSSPFLSNNGDSPPLPAAGLQGDDGVSAPMDEGEEVNNIEEGVGDASLLETPSATAAAAMPPRRDFARQTYVFSATLTLGASGRQQRKKKAGGGGGSDKGSKGRGGKGKKATAEDDPIAKIMKRVGVRGEPAVIDMGRRTVVGGGAEGGAGSTVPEAGAGGGAPPPALPSTLRLCSIKSLQVRGGRFLLFHFSIFYWTGHVILYDSCRHLLLSVRQAAFVL